MDWILKKARVFNGSSFSERDIMVSNGIVRFVNTNVFNSGSKVINCEGKYIFPGFVDVHVHLREPGFSYKETIGSGTLAAAHGGFTDVCAMPNLEPVPDCIKKLESETDIIKRDAYIRVYPYGAITEGRAGKKLSNMSELAEKVVAFSDDGSGVQDREVMRSAMLKVRDLDKIIAVHCEVSSLLNGGYINDGRYAEMHGHKGISAESEWQMIERDLALAKETGCKYHVCHVSTAHSVELIRRAKAEGVNISCETAPHYIALCEDNLIEDGRFKMNPPLRSREDREAVIKGLCDGTIDMIATDHAPHSEKEKSRGLRDSAMGVSGLETAFGVCYTHLVKTGILSLEKLIALMHDNPAERFGIGMGISDGAAANFTLFDVSLPYYVKSSEFMSMGRSTPFEGMELYGKCLMTFCGGRLVWKERE